MSRVSCESKIYKGIIHCPAGNDRLNGSLLPNRWLKREHNKRKLNDCIHTYTHQV